MGIVRTGISVFHDGMELFSKSRGSPSRASQRKWKMLFWGLVRFQKRKRSNGRNNGIGVS